MSGWTPIIGNGGKAISQWSSGTYKGAQRRQSQSEGREEGMGFEDEEENEDEGYEATGAQILS